MHARPIAVAALFVTISLSGVAQQAGDESTAENDLPLKAGRTVAIETDEGSWLSLPAWSPDGARIVAIQGPARTYQEASAQSAPGASENIVWIPAAGGASTFIAPTDGRSAPHFTQDTDRIFLSHSHDGLVSIRWDGTDEKAHVKVTGPTQPGAEDLIRASLVLMAPEGDRALAQVNSNLYIVTVPYGGGETPTVSVADPATAIVPARTLTDVGGQFPAWSADGRRAHWSIGNAHLIYDLDEAKVAEDAADAEAETADADTAEPADDTDDNDAPAYEATEIRIEAGKLTDLVVLEANPLDDIRHTNTIQRVMKNGRLYDGETLDEQWPRQRPLGKLTWHSQDPTTVAAGIR